MSSVSSDRQNLARNSIVGDDPVTNGSVDNYDFDWGEEVRTREVDIFGGCNCHLNEESVQEVEETPSSETPCSCESPAKTSEEEPTEEAEKSTADVNYEIIDL